MKTIKELNTTYNTDYKNAEQYLDKVISSLDEFGEFEEYYNYLETENHQALLTFLAYYAKNKIEISEFAPKILKEIDLFDESDNLETMIIKIAWNIADANNKTMDFVH